MLATVLVLGGMGALLASGIGAWKPDFSAPGIDPRDIATLKQPFEDVRSGRDAELIARLPADIPREVAQAEIDRIQGLLPSGCANVVANDVHERKRRDRGPAPAGHP